MNEIAQRFDRLKKHIAALETHHSRPAGCVTLLAVSKKQSAGTVRSAFDAGVRLFGENYLQEARDKILQLHDLPIEWHFIGQLQSNKTRGVAEHFAWVHSVSSLKQTERLNDQRPDHLPPLNICLQVNLRPGDNRGGAEQCNLAAIADACVRLPRLRLRGLMSLPVLTDNPTQQRDAFHQLHQCYLALKAQGFPLDTLSAGTTHDYEAAIAEGSTMVRIGTALFGPR